MPLEDINLDLNPVKDPNLRYNLEKIKRWAKSVNQRLSLVVTQTAPEPPNPPEPQGGGGPPSTHIFDGGTAVTISDDFVAASDGALLTVQNDAAEPRFKDYPPQSDTLDYTGTKLYLDDSETYTTAGSTEVYRGVSLLGTVAPAGVSSGSTPVEIIENGTFEGAVYSTAWMTNVPTGFIMKGNTSGFSGLTTPGADGTGSCVFLNNTGDGALAIRRESGSPIGDYRCSSIGGALGVGDWTTAYIQMFKNTTYTITFKARCVGGNRDLILNLYAHENNTDFSNCVPYEGYGATASTAAGVRNLTVNTWVHNGASTVTFSTVPDSTTWQTYTLTIDTSAVGTSIDPFYVDLIFNSNYNQSSNFYIDDISMIVPGGVPTPLVVPLTIYGQTFDQLVYAPSMPDADGSLAIDAISNLHVVPTLTPTTAATGTVSIPYIRAATFGFAYDSANDLGTTTVPIATSAHILEPETGSIKYGIYSEGDVAIASLKSLKLFGDSTGMTSITAGAQGVTDIAYTLPTAQGAASTVLTNDGAGALSWAAASGGGGGGAGGTTQIVAETEIASDTLTGTSATIDISSIVSTYDDIIVRLFARSTRNGATTNDGIGIQFNGDTASANYGQELFAVDGGLSNNNFDANQVGTMPAAFSSPSTMFGYCEIEIPQYAGSKRKIAISRSGRRTTDTGGSVSGGGFVDVVLSTVTWESTAAINQITLYSTTTNSFEIGTHYQVTGRKKLSVGGQGPIGIPGLDGEEGEPSWPIMGQQGSPGATGSTGAPGPVGPPGLAGEDGEPGQPGIPGPAGATGATGATGPQGPAGVPGPPGVDGEDGEPGALGPQGPAGAAGATGATGPTGATGRPGIDGDDGEPGPQGPQGPIGLTGLQGFIGPPGIDGEDGFDSYVAGPRGATGPQGPQGPPGDWFFFDQDEPLFLGLPNGRGTGTTNRIVRWTDGPNGALGDGSMTDTGAAMTLTVPLTTTGSGSVGTSLSPLNPVYAQEMDSGVTGIPTGRNTVLRAWNSDGSASYTATLQAGVAGTGNFVLSNGGFTAASGTTSSLPAITMSLGDITSTVASGGNAFDVTTGSTYTSGTLWRYANNGVVRSTLDYKGRCDFTHAPSGSTSDYGVSIVCNLPAQPWAAGLTTGYRWAPSYGGGNSGTGNVLYGNIYDFISLTKGNYQRLYGVYSSFNMGSGSSVLGTVTELVGSRVDLDLCDGTYTDVALFDGNWGDGGAGGGTGVTLTNIYGLRIQDNSGAWGGQAVPSTNQYGVYIGSTASTANYHGFAIDASSNFTNNKYLYWGSALSTTLASRSAGIRYNSTTGVIEFDTGTTVGVAMDSTGITNMVCYDNDVVCYDDNPVFDTY